MIRWWLRIMATVTSVLYLLKGANKVLFEGVPFDAAGETFSIAFLAACVVYLLDDRA